MSDDFLAPPAFKPEESLQQLKRSLPGQVWEVHADPMLDALDALEAQPFVLRAALAGDHLRVVVPTGTEADALRRTLAAHTIQVQRLTPGAATMEDVFMTLAART